MSKITLGPLSKLPPALKSIHWQSTLLHSVLALPFSPQPGFYFLINSVCFILKDTILALRMTKCVSVLHACMHLTTIQDTSLKLIAKYPVSPATYNAYLTHLK